MDELLTPEEIKIPKDMVAWILKRLNGKDASEFMLALSVNKPLAKSQGGFKFIRTSEQKKAHKAYVESLKKLEEGCPDCKGEKVVEVCSDVDGTFLYMEDCPTCQGTGKAKKLAPDRGEIARKLAELDNWNFDELPEKPTGLTSGVNKSHYLYRADQITALMEGRRLPTPVPV